MSDLIAQVGSKVSALTEEFNVIAHNLANVSTVGYKRMYHTFSKSLMPEEGQMTSASDEVDLNTILDFSQGEFVQTGHRLDFALGGKGFFVVETPDGPLYTRNGTFRLNKNNQIVDSTGRIVAGQSGPITIPPNVGALQISVSSDGTIAAGDSAVGKFKLVDFKDNEKQLLAAGMNSFVAPADVKPVNAENLIVKQGFQESSNVRMIEELVDMMLVSKLYEANMKFVTAKMTTTNSIIGVANA